MYIIQHCLLCRPQVPLCRTQDCCDFSIDSHADALTTQLDLISKDMYVCHIFVHFCDVQYSNSSILP